MKAATLRHLIALPQPLAQLWGDPPPHSLVPMQYQPSEGCDRLLQLSPHLAEVLGRHGLVDFSGARNRVGQEVRERCNCGERAGGLGSQIIQRDRRRNREIALPLGSHERAQQLSRSLRSFLLQGHDLGEHKIGDRKCIAPGSARHVATFELANVKRNPDGEKGRGEDRKNRPNCLHPSWPVDPRPRDLNVHDVNRAAIPGSAA